MYDVANEELLELEDGPEEPAAEGLAGQDEAAVGLSDSG
jgi:hypothetical protein